MTKEISLLLDDYFDKAKSIEGLEELSGKNAEIFEELLELEDIICDKYGIKLFSEVSDLFSKFSKDGIKQSFFDEIKKIAKEYLMSKPDLNLQILTDAIEFQKHYQAVLPELNIPTHIYPIFIYENILLTKKDKIENVLCEFETIIKLQ